MELIPLSPLVFLLAAMAEPLAGALGIVVACTTLGGGIAHYGAILTRKSKADVERITGLGFFIGVVTGVAVAIFAVLH